ncbi:DUF4349 domain-containing protein [Aeromicrobium sp. Leaf350]|uniref:DUF4349 domain-containing protein n=1 Tax=Aeromicrobium sp. Leaf350 TaxID=2876565 RepID=UPI001E59BE57|nr:DUF4349 domain-containing protein [Aeromicrobium sp. Leaf350]
MNTSTVLDDERIADLRSRVMGEVETDVRRRGRRTRIAAGGVAASIVLIGGAAGFSAVISGTDPTPSFEGAPVPGGASSTDGDFSESIEPAPGGDAAVGPSKVAEPDQQTVPSEPGRDVITTGQVSLTVSDPDASATDFGAWVEGVGGRVDHRSDHSESSSLTVRVPAGQVNAALEQLRALGDVVSTSVDRVDVTTEVVDLDARIAALQASIARLTQILSTAATTSEVVEAEANLTQRQAELDGLVAQRAALGEQVDLSTIDVSFTATESASSVEPDGFLGGLRTGWNSLVDTVNGLVTGAGVVAPWLVVVLVLAGGAWAVTRRRKS